jgi:hypothetical protein
MTVVPLDGKNWEKSHPGGRGAVLDDTVA